MCIHFEKPKIKMDQNHKIDYKYLLDQILSDKLTSSEKDDLQNYIQDTYNDHQLDLLMHEHWLRLEDKEIVADEIQLLNLKNQIISRIQQKQVSSKNDYQLFPSNWKTFLLRAAAVLFVPLLLSSIFVYYRMDNKIDQMLAADITQRIVANPGSRVHFVLSDETEVWLNSGSKLEFPLTLNQQDSRVVKLSGQGYFKVAHDTKHPFFVETEGLRIKALGTSFDVSNYAEDNQIISTLEEGSIALIDFNGKEVSRLHSEQKAILNKTNNSLVLYDVESFLTTSWKDGKLIFRNTSLSDVTKQLERWFNCKIYVDPGLLDAGLMYTATIQDETLGEVLKMIEISTSVKTRIEKREVFISSK